MLGKLLGRYRILEEIGAGGMGVVYRARDERLERDVAVKVLPAGTLANEEARRRFREEALLLSKLNHANIETVHDFDTQDGVDFLVLELVPGESLDVKLRAGPLPEKEISRLGSQLAQGLAAAHDKGMVHRDLKPANLRVTPQGQLKILDFGLARLLRRDEDVDLSRATMASTVPAGALPGEGASSTGGLAGTLPYMAPEQVRGERADQRTDLYSAGVVLYEMATGRRPFPETQMGLLVDAILHQTPAPPSSSHRRISPALESVILKAIDKEPTRRHQSAADLRVDLERLEAPASLRPPAPSPRPVWHRRLGLLGGAIMLLLVAALVKHYLQGGGEALDSLAVLPFQNASANPDAEYLSDGLTESLINLLSKLPTLKKVIARSSVATFKGKQIDLREVAKTLDVRAVLMGRMVQRGDNLVISAELVDGRDSKHLWGNQYSCRMADLLTVQEDIANHISSGLRLQLTGADRQELAKRYTQDPEAYQLYLKARYYSSKVYSRESSMKALEYIDQAIARDPTFALAYTCLADAFYALSNIYLPPSEAMPKARAAAIKALELDERLAEAHTSLGLVKSGYDWDWVAGEKEYRRAVELNPGSALAHLWFGYHLTLRGRFDEGTLELRQAQELDPLSSDIRFYATWPAFYSHRYAEALSQLRTLIELDPSYKEAFSLLGETYEQLGEFGPAATALRKSLELGGGPWVQAAQARVLAKSGQGNEARKVLAELEQLWKQHDPMHYVTPYAIASIHSSLGDVDGAFEWLGRARDERCEDLTFIRIDPKLDGLRKDPRFQDMLRSVGLAAD